MLKILLFLALVAITVYLVVSAMERGTTPGLSRRARPRPIAPDDDPDFLRQLDEDQWRKRRQRDTDPD